MVRAMEDCRLVNRTHPRHSGIPYVGLVKETITLGSMCSIYEEVDEHCHARYKHVD